MKRKEISAPQVSPPGNKKLPTRYSWRFAQDETRDLGIYEIQREKYIDMNGNIEAKLELPFTVIITDFSKKGKKQLFSDIFFSEDWDILRGTDGFISDDVQFCINLWKEFGLDKELGEDFQPKHINHDDILRRPLLFRNSFEKVMSEKYGCGHTDFL